MTYIIKQIDIVKLFIWQSPKAQENIFHGTFDKQKAGGTNQMYEFIGKSKWE